MRASVRLRLASGDASGASRQPPLVARLLALTKNETGRDVALSVMLVLECVAVFVAAPLAALDYQAPRLFIDFLTLVFALLVMLIARGRTAGWMAAVGAVCVLAGTLAHAVEGSQVVLWMHTAGLLGILSCWLVIAIGVLAPGPVTVHRLLGAIVLYLTAALAFGLFYRLLWEAIPAAFVGMPAEAGENQAFSAMVYFSFVTLTSTGFGDILPVHPFVRSVANFEAVVGQLYPATLLAALLTQHLDARRQRTGNPE